jgi:hypothetical protein
MHNQIVTADFGDLAKVLLDDLASEIDLHYDDNEMSEAAPAIEKIKALQDLVGGQPSETVVHILERFDRCLRAGI